MCLELFTKTFKLAAKFFFFLVWYVSVSSLLITNGSDRYKSSRNGCDGLKTNLVVSDDMTNCAEASLKRKFWEKKLAMKFSKAAKFGGALCKQNNTGCSKYRYLI